VFPSPFSAETLGFHSRNPGNIVFFVTGHKMTQ